MRGYSMIDYRIPLIQFITDKTTITAGKVFDGTLSFDQPSFNSNYATYYILNEEIVSIMNNTKTEVNQVDNTLVDITYTPFTIATIQIDIRGVDSFTNIRTLVKSFDTITNKKFLASQGVYVMSVSGITPLPQIKNTANEEGYLIDLTVNYDNSFIEQVDRAAEINITKGI